MRIINSLLFVLMSAIALLAQPCKASLICSPKENKTSIWMSNEESINAGPLFMVSIDDRLCITDEAKGWFKIWVNGKTGWVRRSEVIILSRSKSYEFERAEIMAHLDNPLPIYIIDTDMKGDAPISLNRSFKENLQENTDKQTFEQLSE